MKNPLVVGSRDSALALAQTYKVMEALKGRYSDLDIPLKTYKTQGDLILDSALSKIGDKGLFVKELEVALLSGEIDFAVHSMKDMPSEQPDGLRLFSFGPRELPEDAWVSKHRTSFWETPQGAIVGTSSLRRQAILKKLRPDLNFQVVRGNVQTRLRKLEEGPYDALVLAAAGLRRLGLEAVIMHTFSPSEMLPACCQGTLGVEIRNDALFEMFSPFVDPVTETCTQAERSFLKTLQGGCQVPMAAYAEPIDVARYHIWGLVSNPDGTSVITAEKDFTVESAQAAGRQVAEQILRNGGKTILDALWHGETQQ
jgi:hydroxymethylbilane synthase